MNDYKKQLSWAKLRVGLVVTAALAIIFFTILFAGNIRQFFVSQVTIHAVFDDVKGLQPGAPVWLSGVQIGSVEALRFAPGEKVKVGMSVDSDALARLKKNSRASILTLGLLGDKYVDVSSGSKGARGLEPGDTIEGSGSRRSATKCLDWSRARRAKKALWADCCMRMRFTGRFCPP